MNEWMFNDTPAQQQSSAEILLNDIEGTSSQKHNTL